MRAAHARFVLLLLFVHVVAAPSLRAQEHNVGFRLLKLEQEGKAPLVVALWYPTQEEPRLCMYAPVIDYLEGAVAVESVPAQGPFPLVLFSHGGTGAGVVAMSWAEALAAEGFVVAGPDHSDEAVYLRSDLDEPPPREKLLEALKWAMRTSRKKESATLQTEQYDHRPREIRATIDALLEASADTNSPLHGLIDPERIGLTGTSFGSWTTSVVAGGVKKYHDPRIKAAIRMAPGVAKADLSLITIPTMTIFGEKETLLLLDKGPDAILKEEGIRADFWWRSSRRNA